MCEDDLATAALLEFLNAAEAGIVEAKRLIAQAKGVETYDPSKIKWEEVEGSSGPYERSEDVNNPEFKSMLRDLATHGGKLTRNGYFFWVFKNGHTVGRKQRNKGEASDINPEKLGELFPEDLKSLLSFKKDADAVVIEPTQFLGSENFAKILEIAEQHGGEWVRAGKNSHFQIPLRNRSHDSTA